MDHLEETKYLRSKRCPQCGLPLKEHQAKLGDLVENVMSCSRCERMWFRISDEGFCEQVDALKPGDSWSIEQMVEHMVEVAKEEASLTRTIEGALDKAMEEYVRACKESLKVDNQLLKNWKEKEK